MAFTNAFCKLFICATPQNSDLTEADYNLLTWVEIGGVGNVGETGKTTNIVTYNEWGTSVSDKAKGITNAGDPTIEVARNATDAGQVILRAASAVGNNNKYALKIERNDEVLGGEPTIQYNRGLIAGPTRPNGANEDFDLEVYTAGLVQEEIIVDPTVAGNPPVLTVAPALSGVEQSGETLTCSTGTFTGDATIVYTYQWFKDGIKVSDSEANTYDLTAADVGSVLFCRVMAKNDSGSAYGYSDTTAAITA